MNWPVVIHVSLANTDYYHLLRHKNLKVRVSEGTILGSVIFPVSGVAFVLLHLRDILHAGDRKDTDTQGLSLEVTDRLDKFLQVHRRCYAVCTAATYGQFEQQLFSRLQTKYLFTRLRLLISHNAAQGVDTMVTIAKSLCKPMNEVLHTFMSSVIADQMTADVITTLLSFIGLNSHQCEILQDGMGSLANVAKATIEDLLNCSLDREAARKVHGFFNKERNDSEE